MGSNAEEVKAAYHDVVENAYQSFVRTMAETNANYTFANTFDEFLHRNMMKSTGRFAGLEILP